MISSRCWTAYEKNWLLKHGFSLENLEQYGQMPVEYITGFAEFCNLEFVVNDYTLIPWVESEGLVDLAIQALEINEIINPQAIDLGTGCGAIGLSLFHRLLGSDLSLKTLLLTDVSSAALDVARMNLSRLIPEQHRLAVNIVESDLFSQIPQQLFNIIIANLPYVPSGLLEILDHSVKYYEPELALDGGEDGLKLVREFLRMAPAYLAQDGQILLEIDSRSQVSHQSLGLRQSLLKFVIIKDACDRQRYLVFSESERKLKAIEEQAAKLYNESLANNRPWLLCKLQKKLLSR